MPGPPHAMAAFLDAVDADDLTEIAFMRLEAGKLGVRISRGPFGAVREVTPAELADPPPGFWVDVAAELRATLGRAEKGGGKRGLFPLPD